MIDQRELKMLELLLQRRLSQDEAAELSASAKRAVERGAIGRHFSDSLKAYRQANPAAVSPRWGFA